MASGSITSWQIDRETMETVTDFILRARGLEPLPRAALLSAGRLVERSWL